MRQQEFQHNTPEQVRDYLLEALAIVDELKPPEDLREACFQSAVNMLSAKQIVWEQPAMIPDLGRH